MRATLEAMKEAAASEAHVAALEKIELDKCAYLDEHLRPAEEVLAAHAALADRPSSALTIGDDSSTADVRVDAETRFWSQEHAKYDDDDEEYLTQDHVKEQVASLVADQALRERAFSSQKTPEVVAARQLVLSMLMGHEQRSSAKGLQDKVLSSMNTQELPAHRSRAANAAVEALSHYNMARNAHETEEGNGTLW